MSELLEKIRVALAVGRLRGEESHIKMMPAHSKITEAGKLNRSLRQSSVLLLLVGDRSELSIVLIKRPLTMRHHAGQIAFPGGGINGAEIPLDAALRETEEEIGVASSSIKILGELSELTVDVSGFIIYPFVGWIPASTRFMINPFEVEKLILFPVVLHKELREEVEVEASYGRMTVPCFKYNDEIVWGATSMILTEFFDLLEDNGVDIDN